MADRASRRVLEAWVDRLQPLHRRVAEARWAAALDASEPHRQALEEAAARLDAVRHDAEGFQRVERSLVERLEDGLLRRALLCLRLELLPHVRPRPAELLRLESEAHAAYGRFQAEVDGRSLAAHEVVDVLRRETDGAVLERTWRAAMALGERLAPAVREMARLRNEHARALGRPGFRALELSVREVDELYLEAFLSRLAQGSEEAWREQKAAMDEARSARLGILVEDLRPWHYGDLFLQSPPPPSAAGDPFEQADPVALARRTFEGIELDVEPILARSDLLPRAGKNPHAFCMHLDREGDVRVLANVVPSRRWTATMLHELGHAVYEENLDADLPWPLRRPPHACVTEGVAMLFGRLADDPAWRTQVAGLPEDPGAEQAARERLLCFLRWGLVVARFEERLYADPDQDLDEVWWDLVERLQGIPRPDPLPRGAWAAKIHVACHPVYYHAYLLGECVASQLARRLRERAGGLVESPEAARLLVEEVFRPGASRRWDELVASATGAPLSPASLLADAVPAARPA